MGSSDHFIKSSWMLTLASLAGVVAALYLARGVLIPLTLAVLLSFLLAPVCGWLERRKLGRIPSVLVTAVLAFTLLGTGAWAITVQMIDLAPRIPAYQRNIQTKLHSVNDYFRAALNKVRTTAEDIGQSVPPSEPADEPQGREEKPQPVRVVLSPPSPLQVIGGTFGSMFVVMCSTGIVIVLVVFFLIRREDLRDRFIRLIGGGQVTVTTQTLEDAITRVSRFLLTQLLINITFGLSIAIGLYFIGLPSAILWGILATALRFIPYIGAWSAAAAPIGLAMAISTGWVTLLLTLGLFVVLELFVANVMEPWIFGKNTGMSSTAILVAAVFWTWLWGPIGLLVATPLTLCLLVIGKHVPQLSFLDTLLGNEPVFELKTRVYQRLLAGDQEEAAELVLDDLENRPLVEVYDTVLIPALAMAETHWHRGDLNEDRHKFMFQSLKETVEELGERQQELKLKESKNDTSKICADSSLVNATDSSRLCILCLPARDATDEIAGMMLAQVLEMTGCLVQAVSVTALVSEMVDLVEQRKADVVCISAMPPAAATHARYLCKRLRGRFPEAQLIVGLWNVKGDLNKAKERIGCGAATHVVGTLADAQEQIRLLIQPLLLRHREQLQPDCGHAIMV
jgi:predicted PurR-regulated permease PerM/methylmalonyl-CoA mutase cobalamin-binding subunit